MPDDSPPKLSPHPSSYRFPELSPIAGADHVVCGSRVDYAELVTRSNFTFLTGASHPHELVVRAKQLGYRALGIADTNTLAGVVRAHIAARKTGLPLRVGCRLVLAEPAGLTVVVYPTDLHSYARLCVLLTLGKRRAPKAQCHLTLHDLLDHASGLVGILIPPRDIDQDALHHFEALAQGFDRAHFYIAANRGYRSDDRDRLRRHADLAGYLHCPLLASNDVLYHVPQRRPLHDVVTCVRHGCTLDAAGYRLQPHAERHLKAPEEMARLFVDYPDAIDATVRVAEQTRGFGLEQLSYQYPSELVPDGADAMQHLAELATAGAFYRFKGGITGMPDRIKAQLEHELELIDELGYAHYFLTVEDMVRYARGQGILCQGRGAAANSIVCYCLGVTDADPRKINTLFERFVSRQRDEPPDIDIDFEHQRREEVIQYLYRKYGRDRAALTAEVITYRGRSAVREVGKTLGLSLDVVDRLAKGIDWWNGGPVSADQLAELRLDATQPAIQHMVRLSAEVQGFPRHLGQHVGGFVLTESPLCELVPIENAAMAERTVIEWDKDDIDELKILKVDVLGLGMLTVLSKAYALLAETKRLGNEETKRRRDEETELKDGRCEDVSRLGRVAKGDGIVSECLSRHEADARQRAVWVDQPDAAQRGVGAVEHRRRVRAGISSGPLEVSQDRPGIAQRASHAVRTCHVDADDVGERYNQRLAGGDGPSVAGPDKEPRAQEIAAPNTSLHLCVSSLTSSLRLCVSSSLHLCPFPDDDPATYDMICRADTIGVFQIESRAQMSMLPRLQPREYYDLVIEVAIVRPGPIQGQMVHPYLRRRRGEEPVDYPDEKVERILGKTLGVPLFQEQAMQLAIECAGFSPDDADQLRRAVTGFKHVSLIEAFGERIVGGMLKRGYPAEFAQRCFKQIQGFSTYGFPESHAASFAILAYASSYLKCHYPDAFCCALLNSQPMGFYAPSQLVQDAQRHGVVIRPIDVHHSRHECTLEPDPASTGGFAVRLGLNRVRGLKEQDALRVEAATADGTTYPSIEALWRAAGCSAAGLRRLAAADAFGSMGLDRQSATWHARKLRDRDAPLFEPSSDDPPAAPDRPDRPVDLPRLPELRHVVQDIGTTGVSLRPHPMSFLRPWLDRRPRGTVVTAEQLADPSACPQDRPVAVAGICLVRQRPGSAKNITFMTLEDETGTANLVVYPQVFERHLRVARHATVMLVHGTIDRQGQVVHIKARRFTSLDDRMADLRDTSRNFH
jgi:error-prone DNA polymerase